MRILEARVNKDSPYDYYFKFKYSTMDEYFGSVFNWVKENGYPKFDVIGRDYWELDNTSQPGAYWTGLFTTNPEFKREVMALSDYA